MLLTVLLCTHDPRPDHLLQTLAALQRQTLPRDRWELLLVDNASPAPLPASAMAWHPHGRVLRENRLGLTHARVRGITEAKGDLILCDDDNLLAPDYLATAARLLAVHPQLGAAGGKSLPRYAAPPPAWFAPHAELLALRDLGCDCQLASWTNLRQDECTYPLFSPYGAGMILRRSVARLYVAQLGHRPVITDRAGRNLSSGGDNALVLTTLQAGWAVGYFPELSLTHLIPAERLQPSYLARLNREGSRSWVRLLAEHGILPWRPISRWTVFLRQARAYFKLQAWRGPAEYFLWSGACGLFEGRAEIQRADDDPLAAPRLSDASTRTRPAPLS